MVSTFHNPLLPAPSQDPWVTHHAGHYLALTTNGQRIFLRQSANVVNLFQQPPLTVWQAPVSGPNSKHLWAPELHRVNDRWFIYYAADNGRNRNHRLWALASVSDDPTDPYLCQGMIETGGFWAIDATLLHGENQPTFLLWSGWEGKEKGPQNLYIAPLRDPLSLAGPRVLLTRPDQSWEQRGGAAICEGPAVLRRGTTTYLLYSASASWTVHSSLGMLVHRGGDYLDPASWSKVGPVFERTAETWGVGHCSLLSIDQEHGAIFYHAKTRRTHGWRDRNIRAQPFRWTSEGLPMFDPPVSLRAPLPKASPSEPIKPPARTRAKSSASSLR